MPASRSIFYWNWQRTAVVAIAILAGLQFFRANLPLTAPAEELPAKRYTTGVIVDAPVVIPPRDHLSYKAEFNRRTKITGEFFTANNKIRIECLLLDAANYELWNASSTYRSISATGYVPGGKVVRVVEPGTYYIVISNRSAPDSDVEKSVQVKFAAE